MNSQNNPIKTSHRVREGVPFTASFEDYLSIFKRKKNRLIFFAVFFACAVFLYFSSRPISYEGEATFREQGLSSSEKKEGGFTSLMALGSSSDHQSKAITVLKSKNLMKRLIEKLGLQIDIVPLSEQGIPFYHTFRNIKAEGALLLGRAKPGVEDLYRPIRAMHVHYEREVPATFSLTVINSDRYFIEGEGIKGEGEFGKPLTHDGFSFTLNLLEDVKSRVFTLKILPKRKIASTLSKKMKITPDQKDKRVVNLKVTYEDRVLTSAILNSLMELYKEWLEEENKKVAEEQIAYLRQREEEENRLLTNMLYKHAIDQADKMDRSGFASNLLAMDFLTKNLQEYVQKITNINLEVERLSRLTEGNTALVDVFPLLNVPEPIASLLKEIRSFKLEVDALVLSIKNHPHEMEESPNVLSQKLLEIDEAEEVHQQLKSLFTDLKSEKPLTLSGKLINNKRCSLETWIEKIAVLYESALNSSETSDRWEAKKELSSLKEQFAAYLSNLIHYFQIQEKTLKERIQHLTEGKGELEGVGLLASKELLQYYNKELNSSESEIVKNQFLLQSIKNKDLEISPLSSMVEDPMGKEIIGRHSKLLLDLQNSSIRSQKEQERIKEELMTQRKYLEMHITQSTDILALKIDLIKEAIYNLQTGMLGLYREQIAILENQIGNFINQRVEALLQEKGALYDQIFLIRDELKSMPEKRIQELMIEQKIDLVKKIYTQIVQTIEAKNLQSSLEVVQSIPIDIADTPYFPKNPYLLLLTLAGGFLGFFFSAVYYISKEGFSRLKASERNLKNSGFFVAGSLTLFHEKNPLLTKDLDLETLRRLIAYLNSQQAKRILLLEGEGPHYAETLGSLFGTMGEKTLVLSLNFHQAENPGLLQLVNNPLEKGFIVHHDLYDILPSGGPSRLGTEMILRKHFKELLSLLEKEYDRIVAYSDESFSNGSTYSKIGLFECLGATVSFEKTEDIAHLLEFIDPHKIAFLFYK